MVTKEIKDDREDQSCPLEKEINPSKEVESSDNETGNDFVSPQVDSQTTKDRKVERALKNSNKHAKRDSADCSSRASRARTDRSDGSKTLVKASHSTPKKPAKVDGRSPKVTAKSSPNQNSKNMKVHPKPLSESSEGLDDKSIEEVKEIDALDESPVLSQIVGSDDETVNEEENGLEGDCESVDLRIEEMESRIEKLEEELREVAALEISLYSVVPEHGSSAHKVHTPARRLSRLYIHACKHWTQDKRATTARNTVSGLVLVAKSCGHDVPRLTFWLSNTVVLREILSQAFGTSLYSNPIASVDYSNGGRKSIKGKPSSLNRKGVAGSKHVNIDFTQFVDDWQETRTFTVALEKVESWIFSRIVESVWWQTLTPHMQSPVKDMYTCKVYGRMSGPSLGDQQQGQFSINLWQNAFQDAFRRLCPVRAGGHECGCLPILARMVMEQCVARLDVAMFNAILRESADEIPTDPVSDPIVDSKVLPIPAGNLSFGSGAQLKNSIGNWSRWLTDLFGMDTDENLENELEGEDDDRHDIKLKSFGLLNSLSDLLMLPKDMLMDRSIRKEVCPAIGLPLVKRILCNFTPDDFCPDPVPGAILESLNAESVAEWRLSDEESAGSFPYNAAPVVYIPPSLRDVAEKVLDTGGKSHLRRNASIIQRKGYTSDDDLDELNSPLTSIINKSPPKTIENQYGREKEKENSRACVRYELLREVWSVQVLS